MAWIKNPGGKVVLVRDDSKYVEWAKRGLNGWETATEPAEHPYGKGGAPEAPPPRRRGRPPRRQVEE